MLFLQRKQHGQGPQNEAGLAQSCSAARRREMGDIDKTHCKNGFQLAKDSAK